MHRRKKDSSLDKIDSLKSISLHKSSIPKDKLIMGSLKGLIPVYFPERRMIVYTTPNKVKKVKEKYSNILKIKDK